MILGPTREATSLYQHEWEDEMRLRVEVQKYIGTNWQICNDPQAKEAAVAREYVRQKQWQIRFDAKRIRPVSHRIWDLELPLLETPVGESAIGWYWVRSSEPWKHKEKEELTLKAFIRAYNPSNGGKNMIPENQILGRPCVKLHQDGDWCSQSTVDRSNTEDLAWMKLLLRYRVFNQRGRSISYLEGGVWESESSSYAISNQSVDFQLRTRVKGLENTEGWNWAQVVDKVFVWAD